MIKIFIDMDGTIAKFNVRNAINRFATEQKFFSKLSAYKGIETIDKLASQGNIYIISASPNERTDADKREWLNRYLPSLKSENIIFCRIGENKAKVIKDKLNITIDKTCFLLDDYTKNLIEWKQLNGIGIKRITSKADNSTKKWQGYCLRDLRQLYSLIMSIASE